MCSVKLVHCSRDSENQHGRARWASEYLRIAAGVRLLSCIRNCPHALHRAQVDRDCRQMQDAVAACDS